MPVAAAFVEIRYRRTDSIGQWTFVKIPAGQDAVRLTDVERGVQYQIEARSVAASGAASDWVTQTHIVNSLTITPLVPIGFAAAQLTDGVHLTWSASDVQRSDVEYEIQRTSDISGAPDPAGWTTINRTKALRFTDGVTDAVTRWYRVRSSTYGGVNTAFSTAVSSSGKPPAVSTDNLIKNGDFDQGAANWAPSPNWGGTTNVSFLTGVSGLPKGSSELKTPATATVNQESQEYIPVDVTKTYFVEAWVKIPAPLTGALGLYLGLVEYDSSKAMLNHNAVSGPTNLFCLANNVASTTGNTYQYLSAEISGDGGTTPGLTQFHTGTKYVRAIGLFNWSGSGTPQQIEVLAVRLSEVAAGNTRALKLLRLGISSDLNKQGSIVPGQSFTVSYTFTDTSISLSWAAQSLLRADNTTLSVSSGSQSYSSLTAATLYHIYGKIVVSGSSGTIGFTNGSPPPSGASGNSTMAAQAGLDGNIPLTPINITTAATSGGSGSGSGGDGGTCPEKSEVVNIDGKGDIAAWDAEAEDFIKGYSFKLQRDVYRRIVGRKYKSCAAWRIIDGKKVTPCEPVYYNGQWMPAFKVPGAVFDGTPGICMELVVEADEFDEHNYWLVAGDKPLLIHNPILPRC